MSGQPNYNYRDLLRSEYGRRRERNASYSLRAFARDLDVAYSRLNEILNGKRGVSQKNAIKLADALRLNSTERELFLTQIESEHGRSKTARSLAKSKLETILVQENQFLIQKEVYQLISDWYHYAILELTLLKEFQSNVDWISSRLGISKIEAEGAIQRLLKLELLEEKNGRYFAAKEVSISPSGIPSKAIKKHHEQVLTKASDAIHFQDLDERDLSAVTVAVSKKRLPLIKEKIKNFRRSLMKELDEETEDRDAVYCLAVQLFRLDQAETPLELLRHPLKK